MSVPSEVRGREHDYLVVVHEVGTTPLLFLALLVVGVAVGWLVGPWGLLAWGVVLSVLWIAIGD